MSEYQIVHTAVASEVIIVTADSFEEACELAGYQSRLTLNASNHFDLGDVEIDLANCEVDGKPYRP